MEDNSKRSSSKVKERRQPYVQNEAPPKRNPKGLMKRDLSQLVPPDDFPDSSSVNKVLNEANKIVKIGMEREFALLEKSNTLQNSNETIDNLRKNILHLQMEYEKLDQNYQREISYRSEISKRMDSTKDVVESAVQYSNILASSIKQLEEDKFKIVEFYELIYQNQKEVEGKHNKVEKFLKEQDELLKTKLEDIKKSQERLHTQHDEIVSQLNRKLSYAHDKLKISQNAQEELKVRNQELQENVTKLETTLETTQRQHFLLQQYATKLKCLVKNLKVQKSRYQKLWKSKKKLVVEFRNQVKNLKKSLRESEALCDENSNLELKIEELRAKFTEHLEEDEVKYKTWTAEKDEFLNKITTLESRNGELEAINKELSGKVSELEQNEEVKRTESDQLQNDLSKMFDENLILKENIKKLSKENDGKSKLISDLEIKMLDFGKDFNAEVDSYKKELTRCENLVKDLKTEVSELQSRLSVERSEKEAALTKYEHKMKENQKETNQKIKNLENLLEEKKTLIRELESRLTSTTSEGQNAVGELNHELQNQKFLNEELCKAVQNLTDARNNLSEELEKAKQQISDAECKLNEERSTRTGFELAKIEFEKTVARLKHETELERKSFQVLNEDYKKMENEMMSKEKVLEENNELKSSLLDLRKHLEDTQARMEAYKVVIKKLESEKLDSKNKQSEEVMKLKLELSRFQEATKGDLDMSKYKDWNTEKQMQNKGSDVLKSRPMEPSPSQKLSSKENQREEIEIENFPLSSTPQPKSILSTPRTPFASKPGFRNLTPIRKKRDPYEFDSDSSVERFDADKVLKVFNRQKKQTTKKPKTNK